jgi:hypothetical protein
MSTIGSRPLSWERSRWVVGCFASWMGVGRYYTDAAWYAPAGGKSRFFILMCQALFPISSDELVHS